MHFAVGKYKKTPDFIDELIILLAMNLLLAKNVTDYLVLLRHAIPYEWYELTP